MLLFHRLARRSLLVVVAIAITAPLMLAYSRSAHAAPAAPPPGSCPSVRVLSVELVRGEDGSPALAITGVKPHADASVRLVPEDVVYVIQPDYWTYFVEACGGTGPVTKNRFRTVLPITGPTGRCGIEIPPHLILIDPVANGCPLGI
jgi:hypothetical protein